MPEEKNVFYRQPRMELVPLKGETLEVAEEVMRILEDHDYYVEGDLDEVDPSERRYVIVFCPISKQGFVDPKGEISLPWVVQYGKMLPMEKFLEHSEAILDGDTILYERLREEEMRKKPIS